MARSWLGSLCVLFALVIGPAAAAPPTRQQVQFFEKEVRPILAGRCYQCHSEAQKKQRGGLHVDSLAALLRGGDSGPALVPGAPDKSLLVEAIGYGNEDLRMPPKGKLSADEIAVLTRWVKDGAAWPQTAAAISVARRKPGQITDEDRRWWAFQPVKEVALPPAGDGWARNPIDRFIAARLNQAQLTPAPEASRTALIRRLAFDLVGLPPTPAEVAAFLADRAPDAYEKLVERYLASPHYGERWARHWLDLVRYADSDGYRIDDYRPTAWRYRDYVIAAFNADRPYDRFVQEQLAGDELFPGDPTAIVALGYLRHWIYEYNARDVRGQWTIILNDLTDTTGDVFLGLGMQCARCHDHKFDPILQKDYFRLQAFFSGFLPVDDVVAATQEDQAAHAARMKPWEAQTAQLRAEIAKLEEPYRRRVAQSAIEKFPDDIQAMIAKPADKRETLEHQLAELACRQVDYEYNRLDRNVKGADKERLLALRRQLAEFDRLKPPPLPVAPSVIDVGPVAAAVTIPKKGDTPIEPGFPTILDAKPAAIEKLPDVPRSTGRRAALARWLTRSDNPLTARVIVNRVWQQHFGRGLAANASDFGHLGEPPTHPELLDWLAGEFVREGWSLKRLHRLIVTSATYRQAAEHPQPAAGRLADPENRLLWRAGVRRLEAEQIRDALLAVTGELNLTAGGPGTAGAESRRSIYTRIMRNSRDPLLDVFDAPFWFSSASSRDTTTTPVQSLLLINSSLMLSRAKALAQRLAREEPDEAARVGVAYRLAFGREPTAEERSAARAFLERQAQRVDPNRSGSAAAAFKADKVPYRDGQAADVRLGGRGGFFVPASPKLPAADFTIEAFVYPKSIADSGAVRVIAARWNGDMKQPGWAFGITGKQSRRKPQTVVLQMVGPKADGRFGEEALFSDQHVALNKPYYLAAAVHFAKSGEKGFVQFYLKDLSNDDEPLLVARVDHAMTGGVGRSFPLTLAGRATGRGEFDGLLDDVRISESALGVEELLFTREGTNQHTLGYWQFEAKPSVFRDMSGHGLDITPGSSAPLAERDVRTAAWVDFCQVLLNASEFLYVE